MGGLAGILGRAHAAPARPAPQPATSQQSASVLQSLTRQPTVCSSIFPFLNEVTTMAVYASMRPKVTSSSEAMQV